MAISPTNIQILFTNYDIITYFLNLVSCSEHFISIKHRILATFNINKKIYLSDCMPLRESGTLLIFKVKGQGHCVKFLRQFSMHFVIANSPT